MRHVILVCALAACGGGAREAALERRMTDLETIKPAPPPPDPRIAELEQRVEALSDQIHELTEQITELRARPVPPPSHPRAGLDPDRAYAVPLDDSPVLVGDARSPVTMVLAVQFPEPYTHRAWPTIRDVIAKYGSSVRVVVKAFVVHPQAHDSTIAGCAVAYQGLLDLYDDAVWAAAAPPPPGGTGRRWPDAAEARTIAKSIGANLARYDKDVAGRCGTAIARDEAMFKALGQAAVPVFWIEGRPLEGAQPIAKFEDFIDTELKKAADDAAHGGAAATYYQRVTGSRP